MQSTKQPDNKTTRQQNNQTTLTYFYLLIFYFYLLTFYPICLVYTFTNYSSKICLEDNTERSESNPGRSLGTTTKKKRAVWKTVPTQTEFTCSSLRDDHKCSKSITDNGCDGFYLFHGFHLILCSHLILDLLRIVFAPIQRWIASSKR